jgi:uncharacterized repeat protein (TIGR01451 family)
MPVVPTTPPPSPVPAAPTTSPIIPPPTPLAPPPLPDNRLAQQAAENTVGRQDAAVSVEWVGPPAAKIGVATEYVLIVRNTAAVAVHDVKATAVIPAGLRVAAAEPAAGADGAWALGTLDAKQEKLIKMKLVAEARGDPMPQAFVTFTSVASLRLKVREPKVVLKAAGPERVMAGESVAFTVAVSNPGDGTAEQVKVRATLSEGLESAAARRSISTSAAWAPASRAASRSCARPSSAGSRRARPSPRPTAWRRSTRRRPSTSSRRASTCR